MLLVAHDPYCWHEFVPLTNTTPLARVICMSYVLTAYFSAFGAEMVALDVEVRLCRCLPAEAFHGRKII
eukprot:2462445-Ditylum_brightwellii.AAC.2